MALRKIKSTSIADDAIDSDHYVDASIDNAHLADDAVGVAELSATGTASSSTYLRGDGAWASVDLASIRNDIATLALHSAITDNKAAYNLSNAFIDQFEDDTGIDAETDCDRNASEYMSSITGLGGNDTYTVLLLHCNAGSTSSSFVDSSASPHTITASDAPSNPNQQGNGATIKFGASSAKYNNVSYLSVPDHADWYWGSDDWTIDFWLRHPQHCSTDHFDFVI